jgi:hypothetical protein
MEHVIGWHIESQRSTGPGSPSSSQPRSATTPPERARRRSFVGCRSDVPAVPPDGDHGADKGRSSRDGSALPPGDVGVNPDIVAPCAQRPAAPTAMSWPSLAWVLALLQTFTVVADSAPVRGLMPVATVRIFGAPIHVLAAVTRQHRCAASGIWASTRTGRSSRPDRPRRDRHSDAGAGRASAIWSARALR